MVYYANRMVTLGRLCSVVRVSVKYRVPTNEMSIKDCRNLRGARRSSRHNKMDTKGQDFHSVEADYTLPLIERNESQIGA